MSVAGQLIRLDIAGLGIVLHSPESAQHIEEGEDYLSSSYMTEQQVQAHIQQGTIVGFGTGSPGSYLLHFHDGYPTDADLQQAEFKLRLGLRCIGGVVCVRDLYELLDWQDECPAEQSLALPDGIYHLTLLSDRPESGVLGDGQRVDIYLQSLESFPALAKEGIPTLCC